MVKTPAELEAALLERGITSTLAKMIVAMATSTNIERFEHHFLIPVAEVLDMPIQSKRDIRRCQAKFRPVLEASVHSQEDGATRVFPVLVSIQMAWDSKFVQYSFSNDFMRWVGLSSEPTTAVH